LRRTQRGANRGRRRPTASPEQPGFLKLRARGNDAAWRRATCDGSRKQHAMEVEGKPKQAWIVRNVWVVRIVRIVGVVRVVAGIVRKEAKVVEAAEVEWTADACGG
jgi:hypothetical protein